MVVFFSLFLVVLCSSSLEDSHPFKWDPTTFLKGWNSKLSQNYFEMIFNIRLSGFGNMKESALGGYLLVTLFDFV